MGNHTATEVSPNLGSSTIVIAIVIPAVFVIVLFMLIIIAAVLPRITRDDSATRKQERLKKRQEELERSIKTQNYHDWLANQKEKSPGFLTTDPVCAICLDSFADDAQIRGLQCSHAFHKQCLDEYYCAFVYEYCPLCHRTIIPGARAARHRERESSDPIPIMFMV